MTQEDDGEKTLGSRTRLGDAAVREGERVGSTALQREEKERLLAGLAEVADASAELGTRVREEAVDDTRPGWRTRLVQAVLRRSARDLLARVPTWFWEQAVLVALLLLVVWQQARAVRTFWQGALVGLSAASVLVAQKVRSIADRQREENARAGVSDVRVRCADAQAFYGSVMQTLGLLMSLATFVVWPQVMTALYGCGYPLWRRWYRSRMKARGETRLHGA